MSEKSKIKDKVPVIKEKISMRKALGLESFESGHYVNAPNSITMIRILLIGSIITHINNQAYLFALIDYIIAIYTDWLDGYVARKFNQVTEFGAKIDPSADKVLNVGIFYFCAIIAAVFTDNTFLGLDKIILIIIIETILLFTAWIGKPLLNAYGWHKKIGANYFGKLKMGLESASIISAIFYLANWIPEINHIFKLIANYALSAAIIFGIGSIVGHYYLKNSKV